ncbi:rhodanese [Methylobacterium sp. Leaf104]|uniref:rhodanese-like domain-containing protein n=1 Tax=Methylobacterium TaxID=407 RepID=UPI0006F30C9B|nr:MULTISPECIES: rhodanese-like domain-containing protein [Methylobacterium]KQP30863.1 rhodanese [Methylobacterium sp. Leaf104]MCI9879273.1 rhodanese [Methylobacterium goesingense]
MRHRLLRLAVAGTALLLAAASPADSPVNVPEPDGIWTGPQRGYTPATLAGANVIDIDALDALIARDRPVLLDVSLADRRPAGFPDDRPWLPAHRSVPGAVWMANAGAAPLDPAREALFLKRVAELTGSDKGRAVVAFCHPECWGSWNAAKRLVLQGYTRVHWFPEGIEGWQERHPTTVIPEDAAWSAGTGVGAQR